MTVGTKARKLYNQNAPRPYEKPSASFVVSTCVRIHRDWCFEAFVDDTRRRRRPTEQCSGKTSVCTAQEVAWRIAALAHLQEKASREATCPGRRGKFFLVSSPYVRVLQSARFGYRQTEMKHTIRNKQVDNSSQPGPKPKTTTRVRVLQPARFGYTGANRNEAHKIQNKQVDNSSLYQTKPKTTRLQKRVSRGVVLVASTMLHEKCCNTVLQIGAPIQLCCSIDTSSHTRLFISCLGRICSEFRVLSCASFSGHAPLILPDDAAYNLASSGLHVA